MEAYSKHPFGQLSGGQAQRVLIARALAANPLLLLLDEPTASVDSQAEADIYAILNKLQGRMTILMVTHDLRTAVNQVSRLLCVQKNVFSLKPEEVCEHYAIGLYHDPLFQINRLRKCEYAHFFRSYPYKSIAFSSTFRRVGSFDCQRHHRFLRGRQTDRFYQRKHFPFGLKRHRTLPMA